MSPAEIEEYELQTGVMRPGSPTAIERGKRLASYLDATKDKVWVEGRGVWTLVSKDWCRQSVREGHGTGWSLDRTKRRSGNAANHIGPRRGRPRKYL